MHTLKGHYDTTTSLNYHLHYCSPFAARNHMYRKKVKHVDATHRDTKINKHEVQQERETPEYVIHPIHGLRPPNRHIL